MKNSAGLFMIVKPNKAVLLCARYAYPTSFVKHVTTNITTTTTTTTTTAAAKTFLEKISIPRGHKEGADTKFYETALREFIEETGRWFDSAFIYKRPFLLQWCDNGVTYKYLIYVGVVSGTLYTLLDKPNTYTVKLLPNGSDTFDTYNYRVLLKPCHVNYEIVRNLIILPLNKYFHYMKSSQLNTYDSSNYHEFFAFVKSVKDKFDNKKTFDFFHATLNYDKLPLFKKQNYASSTS
jgi:hypothetical protein